MNDGVADVERSGSEERDCSSAPAVDEHGRDESVDARPPADAGSLADEVAGLRAGLSSLGSRLDFLEEECRRHRRSRSRSPRTPTQHEARLERAEARLRTLEASFRELRDFWASFKSLVSAKCDLQAATVAELSPQFRLLWMADLRFLLLSTMPSRPLQFS